MSECHDGLILPLGIFLISLKVRSVAAYLTDLTSLKNKILIIATHSMAQNINTDDTYRRKQY